MALIKDLDDRQLPLLDHLIELRNRLMYACAAIFAGFALCYLFADHIYAFLVQPLADIYQGQTGRRMTLDEAIALGLAECRAAVAAATSSPAALEAVTGQAAGGLAGRLRGSRCLASTWRRRSVILRRTTSRGEPPEACAIPASKWRSASSISNAEPKRCVASFCVAR